MIGQLNSTEIEEVLNREVIGRIGCHADGITYIAPISYAYDGTSVYARSQSGMKIDIMRKNPKVCFEVEAYENMGTWRTVILWGEYQEITTEEDRKVALQMLYRRPLPIVSSEMARLSPHWPFEPKNINTIDGIVYRIVVTNKTGRFENHEGVEHFSKSYS